MQRFIPLVLESYGAFGRELDSFVSVLGSAAADYHGFGMREMRAWIVAAYKRHRCCSAFWQRPYGDANSQGKKLRRS